MPFLRERPTPIRRRGQRSLAAAAIAISAVSACSSVSAAEIVSVSPGDVYEARSFLESDAGKMMTSRMPNTAAPLPVIAERGFTPPFGGKVFGPMTGPGVDVNASVSIYAGAGDGYLGIGIRGAGVGVMIRGVAAPREYRFTYRTPGLKQIIVKDERVIMGRFSESGAKKYTAALAKTAGGVHMAKREMNKGKNRVLPMGFSYAIDIAGQLVALTCRIVGPRTLAITVEHDTTPSVTYPVVMF